VKPFDRLHPAIQHHIVNTLGWPALRELQDRAIEPLVNGEHALLLAPTAGGKTEAAFFPALSKMLAEDWRGLSILYVCPIKALLNNLEPRLQQFANLVGRRVQLWHGDVTQREKARVPFDPPDILLTTPESIEVLLVSRDRARRELLRDVRLVIVDELHAFAGDDRGWHLLAVLERVSHLAGRTLQRIGLSATVGNADALGAWLRGSAPGETHIVSPSSSIRAEADLDIDYVGTLANAATVIAQLHRGEKRLVFCDSRARVEELASLTRERGIETYVSHGSLGLDERRQAEHAFAEGSNCVIIATSTLELGIDVGDLDRVIQIDAPATVASFAQRIGRTGRRQGTRRNCLFLATSDDALLQASAIVTLWSSGFMEAVEPPPVPYHLFAQQILALVLQEGRIGRTGWRDWVGRLPAFASLSAEELTQIVDHMVASQMLVDEGGLLSMGASAESTYGFKNFLALFSVFTTSPVFTVLHGRQEIGQVHQISFFAPRGDEPLVLTLGGRHWQVTELNWDRQTAQVQPAQNKGRSRWLGSSAPLSFALCQGIKSVLAGEVPAARLSQRAGDGLAKVRAEFPWVRRDETTIAWDERDRVRWWTFAGLRANAQLASQAETTTAARAWDRNLAIDVAEPADVAAICQALERDGAASFPAVVDERALEQVKFADCVPEPLLRKMMHRRWADPAALRAIAQQERRIVTRASADDEPYIS
jgi:ATP-dependent Lhr-like helicase